MEKTISPSHLYGAIDTDQGNDMKKMISALAMLAAVATAGNAQAFAYALSQNNVTNLRIQNSTGISFLSGASNNSFANACLDGSNCVNRGGPGAKLSTPALMSSGPAPIPYGNNMLHATAFALGDAKMLSQQLGGAPFTHAVNTAEAKLIANGNAHAVAGNSSASALRSTFVVGATGGTLNFSFDADPVIRAWLSNGVLDSQAEGSLSVNFNIVNNSGKVVFNWAPDGIVSSGIQGGTETADAFTLNTSLTALPENPGRLDYDPAACPNIGRAPPLAGSVARCFNASTNRLQAGIYTLNLSMTETVNLQLIQPIPEPDTLWLLGIGLGAVGLVRRQSKNAA